MCAILGILDIKSNVTDLRKQAIQLSTLQRHRGPGWSGIYVNETTILAHERLAIVDIESGSQPILNKDGRLALAVNGEVFGSNLYFHRAPDAKSLHQETVRKVMQLHKFDCLPEKIIAR